MEESDVKDTIESSTDNDASKSDKLQAHEATKISYSRKQSFAYSRVADEVTEDGSSTEILETLQLDGEVHIVSTMETSRDILCVCYTEYYDFVAAGLTDGTIQLFKVNSGECSWSLRDAEIEQRPGPITAVKHQPTHRNRPITQTLLATYTTGYVKCWHYPTGHCLYTIRENRQTLGLAYHPRLPKFVTIGDDMNLCLYDEETKTQERVFRGSGWPNVQDGHTSRIFSVCFNPKSPHEIISGGWDDTIQFWDTRQPYALRHISGVHICGDGIDISQSGKEILTCAWQRKNPLQLWDYASGKLIVTLEPDNHGSQLYCGKYINNLFIVCGGTDSNLIRIVDLRNHTTSSSVTKLPTGVYALDIDPFHKNRSEKETSAEESHPWKVVFCSGRMIFEIETS